MNNIRPTRRATLFVSLLFKEFALWLVDVFPDHRDNPAPEKRDWSEAQERDAEFDRLISGRDLFKGASRTLQIACFCVILAEPATEEKQSNENRVLLGWIYVHIPLPIMHESLKFFFFYFTVYEGQLEHLNICIS